MLTGMQAFSADHESQQSAAPDEHARLLRRAKHQATGLLLAVVAVFVLTHFLPRGLAVDCVRAVAEAAMVGALADWFAVSALFRRIPLPLLARHTDIIARNQARIGANLSAFVRDKFLDAPSLVTMIRRHDPADLLAQWLTAPDNADLLGRQAARLVRMLLDAVEDQPVEQLLVRALRSLVGQLDLSRSSAAALAALTREGRHQVLLDALLAQLGERVRSEGARTLVADTLAQWLRREHPLKQRVLPTEWLTDKGADAVTHAVDQLLKNLADDPQHELRGALDAALARLIERLDSDPDWRRRGDAMRDFLQNDERLAHYVHGLWRGLRRRLRADLRDEGSRLSASVTQMGQWLGQALAQDAALRVRLNVRLQLWAASFAPEVAQSVADHIRATIARWDAQEMSRLVELHIGRDLQVIRINGTVVGGLIGLLLFAVGNAGALWALASG